MHEYDVICVGGGLGGLAAALRAHDGGASVLVLERSSMVGGVAAYSGGVIWVGDNHLSGGEDSIEDTETYLDYIQGARRPVDKPARRRYLESAVEAISWFAEAGVPFSLIRSGADLYAPGPGSTQQGRLLEVALPGSELGEWRSVLRPSPTYHIGITRDERYHELAGDVTARRALLAERNGADYLTYGQGLAGGFIREALTRRKIPCLLEQRVGGLIVENGRVTGVEVEDHAGEVTQYKARRGVLLATGGYGNEPDAAELEEVPEFVDSAPPVVNGDGLSLAQSVGASMVRGADPFVVPGAHFLEQVHPGTTEPLFIQLLESFGLPHSLVVNREGDRFADESYYGAMISGIRQYDADRRVWTNSPSWFIFDESFHQRYPLGPFGPGDTYSDDVHAADSLAQLGDQIGVSVSGLHNTVERFNKYVVGGEDKDFGRGSRPFHRMAYGDPAYPNPNLGAVETAPFYAVPLTVLGAGLCTFGLHVDEYARVLRRDGQAIPGLYATGNAAATKELSGYVSGLANARNITYAWLAATHILSDK